MFWLRQILCRSFGRFAKQLRLQVVVNRHYRDETDLPSWFGWQQYVICPKICPKIGGGVDPVEYVNTCK